MSSHARRSDHFDGRRFFNPDDRTARGLGEVLRWQLTNQRQPWPSWVDHASPPPLPAVEPGHLYATFVNHATFLVRTPAAAILTDPVFSRRASPVSWAGPARVHAPGVGLEDLRRVDFVLVSHNHYDHMDLPALRRIDARFGPLFLTSMGNRRFLQRKGLERVEELDWWESYDKGAVKVTFAPAQHFASRTPFDRNQTLWGSFWIDLPGHSVYYAADTGYASHFRQVAERLGAPELALLPIGAYEPRWFMKPVHMNPAEAVQAHLDLGAPQSIGMHFGCFPLTDEAIDDPVRELAAALAARGVPPDRFRTLLPGETLTLTG